jgi:hypothetical protein
MSAITAQAVSEARCERIARVALADRYERMELELVKLYRMLAVVNLYGGQFEMPPSVFRLAAAVLEQCPIAKELTEK